ncbi:beta-galactosidase [Candidatus Sumerlaeota bacterium]|nr:beta-galactosidase [Candidatus Sumerlaeota bacterium]
MAAEREMRSVFPLGDNETESDGHAMNESTRLHLGAAYYPEHWPEARWPEDLRLMREAHMTVVRMGEFAWSTMEPEPGAVRLDWLDRAVDLAAKAGLVAVLGTPTAAPPAWLSTPEVLAVDDKGRPVQFGNRCHYCVHSPELHAATRRIVGAMAERFGPNPDVVGWQIDNEFNRVCYCDRCRAEFQRFLKRKFGTLDDLNAHWSTAYWSQTYSDWKQIPIPIGGHNPGLMLEFKRFVTASYRAFQKLQIDLLRPKLRPGVWITHNFMKWFDGYDHYAMSEDLDLASWDWYVGSGHHDYLNDGAAHDLVRGFKQRNFWIMETQPGSVNWRDVNNALNRGEARVMAWHAVAHGADAIAYWQWRSALGGQEQYHGTLVDQSGRPRPFYDEAKELGDDFAKVRDLLAGSTIHCDTALLHSYDSCWSIRGQKHHKEFDYIWHLLGYYRPVAARNVGVDIVSAEAPVDGYALVVAPALVLLSEERAARLAGFVKGGGHLVLTVRTGMKDDYNALLPARQPGGLTEAAGVEVEECYALRNPVPVAGPWLKGTSTTWAERLRVLDTGQTEILVRFGACNGWLDDQPAITVHPYGKGRVYYVGACLDAAAQQILIDHIVADAGVEPVPATPDGIEARKRTATDGREIFIVINHEREEKQVTLPWAARDHLTDRDVQGTLSLRPYGVAVLTKADGKG